MTFLHFAVGPHEIPRDVAGEDRQLQVEVCEDKVLYALNKEGPDSQVAASYEDDVLALGLELAGRARRKSLNRMR